MFGTAGMGVDFRNEAANLKMVTNHRAFALLKSDGSVKTWGRSADGGDSSHIKSELSSGVTDVVASFTAFAALKNDGTVITWGNPNYGGDSQWNAI